METPKDKLKRMTAWDAEPTLSEDDLDGILAAVAMQDSEGLAPGDVDWTPTYDINAAAAAAWLVKAARASPLTEVDPPESGIVTSKVFDNCRAMARIYSAKRTANVTI
jgi:hypothetical protein